MKWTLGKSWLVVIQEIYNNCPSPFQFCGGEGVWDHNWTTEIPVITVLSPTTYCTQVNEIQFQSDTFHGIPVFVSCYLLMAPDHFKMHLMESSEFLTIFNLFESSIKWFIV